MEWHKLGVVYPGYTPSELPINNVLNDLVFTSSDALAAAIAYTDIGINHAMIREEWNENGGILVGGYSTPIYNFMSMDTIRSLNDARGKKIRTAGGAQTEWVNSLGGVPVSCSDCGCLFRLRPRIYRLYSFRSY